MFIGKPDKVERGNHMLLRAIYKEFKFLIAGLFI